MTTTEFVRHDRGNQLDGVVHRPVQAERFDERHHTQVLRGLDRGITIADDRDDRHAFGRRPRPTPPTTLPLNDS
ncbi:MAG: hypothetical protein R2710_23920 [Acidimicrobiales bacterium]